MKELRHYVKRLYTFSGKILYVNQLGIVIVSFLDGIAIIMLIPMLNISGVLHNSSSSVFDFLNGLRGFPKTIALPIILVIYIVLVIGQNLLERNLTIRDVAIHQGFLNELKEEIYQQLLFVKWEFYLKTRKSHLINTLTREVNRVSIGLKMFLELITNSIFTFIQVAIAFFVSAKISILVVIFGLGLAFFSWRFVKQSKSLGGDTTPLTRQYLAGMTDHLNGIKDIKTNTLEKSSMAWLKILDRKMLQQQIGIATLNTNARVSYKIAFAVIISCFIFTSVTLFNIEPEKLVIVIILFSRLWPRFVTIQSTVQQLALNAPAFKVMLNLQNEVEELAELKIKNYDQIAPLLIKDSLECQSVYFKYHDGQLPYTLNNINLKIPANRMTAIVGHSGAGKSTLVDIIMGLSRPERGELYIDGNLITEQQLIALRKALSYVPQDPFLFNESVRENLLLMRPNASEEQMWEALDFAVAADFVRRLPDGLDTQIGDRGIRLSGGERQRLVLARAILRKPSILVLDEATSSLDTDNESKIQDALDRIRGTMTIIVIAHRLSTIQHADQVIVLDQGRIVQAGSYSDLSFDERGLFSRFLYVNKVKV